MPVKKFHISMPPDLYERVKDRSEAGGIGISTQITRDLQAYYKLLDSWNDRGQKKLTELTVLDLLALINKK